MVEESARSVRSVETEARKERILAAATALAAEGGYEAVQMRDVAARADVALGTLYRHYPSKDHLLVSALAQQAEQLQSRFARGRPQGACAADRVSEVLRRASRALEREPLVTAAMVTALGSADRDAVDRRHQVSEQLHSIIASAIDGDELADLDDVVRVLGYVWWAVLNLWVGRPSDFSMGDELARGAQLLLDGR